ncbi:UNVERIFIED_CONTAM: hypothetical protein NCL1_21447 [Trichonephila clavipes]
MVLSYCYYYRCDAKILQLKTMPSNILNTKFIHPKEIERLCATTQDVIVTVTDISSYTSDIKQLKDVVRSNHWPVDHPIRAKLWEDLCNQISSENHVDIYSVSVQELFVEYIIL